MKTNYQLQNIAAASQDAAFVDETSRLTAVNGTPGVGQFRSSVTGRAPIPNITDDLRASFGVDRIPIQHITPIQNESGPNGEPVFGVLNDTRGLIRLVGGGWQTYVGASGPGPYSGTINDYMEITFYGTGLNLLHIIDNFTRTYAVYVDDVRTTSTLYPSSGSAILTGRYTTPHQLQNIASSLTLGLHTVRVVNLASAGVAPSGFEILNSNVSGLININSVTAYYRGKKIKNSASDSIAYNTGVTGTKGGRVVRYLTGSDTLAQAFTAVDSTALYLSNASHSNEEVARTYSWREFGAARNDDFSYFTSAGIARAFTLDDGLTSLAASYAYSYTATDTLTNSTTGDYITFTFVGCGLDFVRLDNNALSGTLDTHTLFIDGVSVGTLTGAAKTTPVVQKVVSGLPYGTHTFRLRRDGAAVPVAIRQFIVYQPKKPSIPEGAIEVCDYNVLANYNQVGSLSGVSDKDKISTGVHRLFSLRGNVYINTWNSPATDIPNFCGGFSVGTSNNGSYYERTFFGTGFEISSYANNNPQNWTVSVDGSSNLSTLSTTLVQGGSGMTFTPATGTMSGTPSAVMRYSLRVSGMTLGVHTIRVTRNSGDTIYADALDIITPIHSHKSNLYGDIQSTLPVGSQSLMDSRTTSPIPAAVSAPKAWAMAVGLTSGPTTTSTVAVPVPDMSLTIKTSGRPLVVSYHIVNTNNNLGHAAFRVYVDGVAQGAASAYVNATATYFTTCSGTVIVPVAAGVHKVDLYWWNGSGTTTSNNDWRSICAYEQ